MTVALISLSRRCTFSTNRRALAVMTSKPAALDSGRVEQRRSGRDGDRARANPVAGVIRRDTAGRHELHLRQRRAHVLDVLRSQRRRREYLDDVGARVVRLEDLGRREAARRRGHTARMTRLDHRAPEDRRDHELRAGVDHRTCGRGVDHRAGAEQESLRQRRAQDRESTPLRQAPSSSPRAPARRRPRSRRPPPAAFRDRAAG